MRTVLRFAVLTLVVFLASSVAGASGIDGDERATAPKLDRAREGIDRPIPLPPPNNRVATAHSTDFQLVGFTAEAFTGGQGILNFARACQLSFPKSRMCTLDEIYRTVNVPEISGGTSHAWVRDDGLNASANCDGWTSSSSETTGVAIGLGHCYGGCGTFRCDTPLVVACCAILEE